MPTSGAVQFVKVEKQCGGNGTEMHDDITYKSDRCPLCKMIDEINGLVEELNSLQRGDETILEYLERTHAPANG